jgi:hypothetical protein
VDFPLSTASWGTITHYALLNIGITSFAGTLFWGAFDTPRTINTGDRFTILPGQLQVRIS